MRGVVALSGALSGIFVVIANAWMNSPTGFEMIDGRPANIDPVAAMLNPMALSQTLHMTLAAYAATGFVVAGIHAYLLLRDRGNLFSIFVLPLLWMAGHRAFPVSLGGVGERAHLPPQAVTLDTHIADVVNVIEAEELLDAVLVGHSYAGVVITGAAQRTMRPACGR